MVEDFTSIFGLEVWFVDEGVSAFGLENSLFPVGSNFFEIVAPLKDNTAVGRFLKRRNGNGDFMVICQCESPETQQARKAQATQLGVRIAWEQNINSFPCMQLHPADTGGAFFELDCDSKGEPQGHWEPAGGDGWPTARHTEVISDFSGVELQGLNLSRLLRAGAVLPAFRSSKTVRGEQFYPLKIHTYGLSRPPTDEEMGWAESTLLLLIGSDS